MHQTLRLLVAASLGLVLTLPAHAGFKDCTEHFAGALPVMPVQAPQLQRELCFDDFAILHSGETKTPLLVAQRLSRSSLTRAKDVSRKDNFYEEARLPQAHRAWLRDYRASGPAGERYDRGHLAPAADMPSENGMAQSFSLANMVPQVPSNNRGPWAEIEKSTRHYVMRASGDVYVLTGAVFSSAAMRLGPGKVAVPSHLYKLVFDPATRKVWAHWLENSESARVSRPISLEELMTRTGIDFYGLRLAH